jgi:hypothetical protein
VLLCGKTLVQLLVVAIARRDLRQGFRIAEGFITLTQLRAVIAQGK